MPLSSESLQREPTLVSQTHYCVLGDVTVDSSAAIAPGVVLQASPGSRIIIGPGTCLSAGVCVQSRQGVLAIGAGVTLGANVLVVGAGSIGDRACISPACTLINPQIASEALLSPGELVGATPSAPVSRHDSNGVSTKEFNASGYSSNGHSSNGFNANGYASNGAGSFDISNAELGGSPFVDPTAASNPAGYLYSSGFSSQAGSANQTDGVQSGNGSGSHSFSTQPPSQAPSSQSNPGGALSTHTDRVYGREQVSQLLSTLFPHRQSLTGDSDQ